MSPILSTEAIVLLAQYNFWRGVEWSIGFRLTEDQRASASVCFFLWWAGDDIA